MKSPLHEYIHTKKMNMIPVTYCRGFHCEITRDVKKSDYIKMCELISERINVLNGSHIKMTPEPITEGGMVMTGLENDKWYKTMRHGVRWEHISDDTYDIWKTSDEILWSIRTKSRYADIDKGVTTYLKAFHGAPVWNLDELNIIKEVFEEYGIKCTDMPEESQLTEYWKKT